MPEGTLLIVEDDTSFNTFLRTLLEEEGFEVVSFQKAEDALVELADIKPLLAIVDLKLPGMDGITFVEKAKKISPDTEFLIITAFGSIPSAVSALKLGAIDYLTKPLASPEELLDRVKAIIREKRPKRASEEDQLPPFKVIFAGMEELFEKLSDVAPSAATILLLGETGTGKSLIARVIHQLSGRTGPFVEINCASLPENLVESELFGFEKGAFTGALKTKPGKLELADKGTLFLDEIAEMSLPIQAKFLRVLQSRKFERLGGLETLQTSARFIVATNKNLEELVKNGSFREDLYYRINVLRFFLPPLRERKKHLSVIADYLIQDKAKKLGLNPKPLHPESLQRLLSYDFPGNIRELENLLERALLLSKGAYLEIDLPQKSESSVLPSKEVKTLKEMEKEAILRALEESKGNKSEAARRLGLPLRTLYHKLKEYDIKG